MNNLGYPFSGVGGWLILGSALTLWLLLTVFRYLALTEPFAAVMAVLFLLPALYVLIGAPLRYALVVLLHTARGHERPPRVDVPELDPFQLPHVFLLVLLTVASSALALRIDDTTTQAVTIGAIAVVGSPFITLVALNDGFDGVNPRNLKWLVSGLGAEVPGLLIVGAAWTGLAAMMLAEDPQFVAVLGTLYLFILAHRVVGLLVYRHRSGLQLETEISPEQETAAEAKAVHKGFQDMLMELHRLCETDRVGAAYQRLAAYLEGPGNLDEASVHASLRDFHDARLRLEFAYHYIDRLVQRREPEQAWQVLAQCNAEDPDFRPSSDEVLISLIAHASPDQAAIVETLLRDFEDRFPDSHLTANALFRRACVCIDQLDRRREGIALLNRIDEAFPNFARQARFIAYRDSHDTGLDPS